MNERQEKCTLLREFNKLSARRTRPHLVLAVSLWQANGLDCALEFIAKIKEYEQAESEHAA